MHKNKPVYRSDEWYMQKALVLAHKAALQDEVPIGAIIVDRTGKIIGRGYNKVEQYHSQQEHAEMRALRQATRKKNDWRLDGATIYVTLEPCLMCLCSIGLGRCARLIYATHSPLFGSNIDKDAIPPLYTKHLRSISSGVCAEQAARLLKNFFKQKREGRHEHLKSHHKKQTAQT